MQTKRFAAAALMILASAWTGGVYAADRSLAPQVAPGSQSASVAPFGVPLAPPIYLVNFVLLYFTNPEVAAYMPAYRAALPQEVYKCLLANPDNPDECPYRDMAPYFGAQSVEVGGSRNKNTTWPDFCETKYVHWATLAPREYRSPEQINEPLGRPRADRLAHLVGIDESMILTPEEYRCMIGDPERDPNRKILFECSNQMTNSNGNADVPLASYGLALDEGGGVRSLCAAGAPCLEGNKLFAGPLEKIAAECRFTDKLRRVARDTPILQFMLEGSPCQKNTAAYACIAEAACPGNGDKSNNTCAPPVQPK